MTVQLIGQKCGMTRVFTPDGGAIPVTVIKVEPNRVVQIKNVLVDGYCALQVTYGDRKISKVNKPLQGHFARHSKEQGKVEPGKGLWEIRLCEGDDANYKVGDLLNLDVFKEGEKVDVQGISKGKGFAGTVKRYNFRCQDATHGNSRSHRVPGSIGQRQTPGRVFKGKKMAGHMGNATCTVQNQKIIKIDQEKGLILVNGGIPGSPNCNVIIKSTTKEKR